jgi:hypothetical protein
MTERSPQTAKYYIFIEPTPKRLLPRRKFMTVGRHTGPTPSYADDIIERKFWTIKGAVRAARKIEDKTKAVLFEEK